MTRGSIVFIMFLHTDEEVNMERLLIKGLGLSDSSISIIDTIVSSIKYYSELTANDIFVDCFYDDKNGIVIAHGRPDDVSLYQENIAGAEVLVQNEPMVFYTKRTGIGMRDARAVSQENKIVLQRTIPIKDNNKVIAVMIEEHDVTEKFVMKDKMSYIKEVSEKLSSAQLIREGFAYINNDEHVNDIFIHEANHRIKNNLQTIISILSLQKRRCKSEETKWVLDDDIARIKCLATTYDTILTAQTGSADIYDVIERVISNISKMYADCKPKVKIKLKCDHLVLPIEKIQTIALIMNEIIQNCFKHGIIKNDGTINIDFIVGDIYGTINIVDDGVGFQGDSVPIQCLGLYITEVLVKEKLKGKFSIVGNTNGTIASVQFPLETKGKGTGNETIR